MQIRQATKEDAGIIAELNVDVQQLHAGAHPHLFKPPSVEAFRVASQELLGEPNNYIYIAEVNGDAVGYIYAEVREIPENAFRYAGRQIYIHHISVTPEHHKKGYGEKLIDAVKMLAEEEGITAMGLDVWSFNTNASRFFERQGFTVYNQRMWLHSNT